MFFFRYLWYNFEYPYMFKSTGDQRQGTRINNFAWNSIYYFYVYLTWFKSVK